MKAQHFFALFLLIAFAACDADFVQPTDMLNTDSHSKGRTGMPADFRDRCLDLITRYWLYATGEFQPVQMVAPTEGQPSAPAGYYRIHAHGDAISTQFARGIADLDIRFDPVTHELTGDMITEFYFGEVLEVKFTGIAEVRINGYMMYLSTDIDEGRLDTDEQDYQLSTGKVFFTLPAIPVGNFILQASDDAKYCIP